MKQGRRGQKSICKNGDFSGSPKYINAKRAKTPNIAAVWGRQYAGKSDKESSHVVGKCL